MNDADTLLIPITIMRFDPARLLNKGHNISPMNSLNMEWHMLCKRVFVCMVNKCVDEILCKRRHSRKNHCRKKKFEMDFNNEACECCLGFAINR